MQTPSFKKPHKLTAQLRSVLEHHFDYALTVDNMTTIISSLKFPDSSSDSESGRNLKGNAEDPRIAPLGEPYKDDRKFFWQRPSAKQSEAIATQVGRTFKHTVRDVYSHSEIGRAHV